MGTLKLFLGLVTVLALASCITADETVAPCLQSCPVGEVLDLVTCKCVKKGIIVTPSTCHPIICRSIYPPCVAYKKDDKGCQTCDCLYRCPWQKCTLNCPFGEEYFNHQDEFGCPACRCKQPPTCKNMTTCGLYCPSGYTTDDLGCDLCHCKPCWCLLSMDCPYGKLVELNDTFVCEY